MEIIVLLVSIDIIASKFLDCYILSTRIENNPGDQNIFYSRLMEKLGIQDNVWLSFLFTILMVGFAIWLLFTFYTSPAYQLLYIFTGLFVTAVQLGMAHSNYYGRKNFITEKLLK